MVGLSIVIPKEEGGGSRGCRNSKASSELQYEDDEERTKEKKKQYQGPLKGAVAYTAVRDCE